MLTHLAIRNIVLIEELEATLKGGLCVLTGETGAGKSILLDALGLLLGNRAETRLIRQSEEQASVAGEFSAKGNAPLLALLKSYDIPEEETLRIRRSITRDGKGKIFINDTPVGQGVLQQVGELLVEVHGQHDQRGLTSTTVHRQLLDGYAGIAAEVAALGATYDAWHAASERYDALQAAIAKAQAEEDYLRHVLAELEELNPRSGEEDELASRRSILQHRAKLLETLQAVQEVLTDKTDVMQAIASAERLLDRNVPETIDITDIRAPLDKAGIELREALDAIERFVGGMGDETESLENAEERLFALRDAARKYHCTVEELPAHRDAVAAQLKTLAHQAEDSAALQAEVTKLRADYVMQSEKISKKRAAAAVKIAKAVEAELAPLKMANCRFQANILPLEEANWNRDGMDKVAFEVSTNPGLPFGSLSKIASGGELSRLMLAIKVVLAGTGSTPTLIFDEIDTGIGGAVADAVGKRLSALGKEVQVLCVTHQPQVASYGTQHLKVEKAVKGKHTLTSVKELTTDERREEIARMLAGEGVTDEARAAAQKLMEAMG